MGMPAVISANGTSTSAIWQPDWMQTPFSVAYFIAPNATATAYLQVTYDNIDVSSDLGGIPSVAAANATWITVAGPLGVSATGVLTSPVRGIQINLVTSTSTGICTATFIQATFGR